MSTIDWKGKINVLVRPVIRQINPYSSARDEYGEAREQMVFIDANENPFDTGVNRYPDPHQKELKNEISALTNIPSSQILLGNGSDEVLDLLFRVFCEPYKDAVITLPPTYGMYKVLAEINAVETIEIPLTTEWQPDVPALKRAFSDRTKLLFLCSPNNPTGNLMNVAEVEEVLESFPGLVVIDEAYIDFASGDSWTNRLQDYPNLVVTQTLSKAYGMAGIRLGICYAHQEIIGFMKAVKPPYNVNQLSQEMAIQRLKEQEQVRSEIQQIKEQRNWLFQELQNIPLVSSLYPSEANFILAVVDDANLRYSQLLHAGIVTRNRSSQLNCQNTLRFTVGTPEENRFLIKTLQELK